MDRVIASGQIVDLILVFVVIEAIALMAYRWATGRGVGPLDIALMLLPGVCLLLALRSALVAASAMTVAAWLAASLAAHLADLWRRQMKK